MRQNAVFPGGGSAARAWHDVVDIPLARRETTARVRQTPPPSRARKWHAETTSDAALALC